MFMVQTPQNLTNHARQHPIFHFVLLPIFFLNITNSFSGPDRMDNLLKLHI
jgi:hypothetical protein